MQHSDLYFYPLQSPIYLASNDMKHILMLNISGVLHGVLARVFSYI